MVSGQTYLPIASKRPERNWRFTTHCRSRMFAFFETRGNRLQAEMFSFVYAGMKPDVDLAHQTEKDLLWIRHEFLSSSRDFGKIIIKMSYAFWPANPQYAHASWQKTDRDRIAPRVW